MKTTATLEFLGTGASMGVPVIGCVCLVCQSKDPKDKRLRSSALIRWKESKVLIDCGPDFRFQALRSRLDALDGLILTHAHFDHVGGFDDLKVFYKRKEAPFPCLLSKFSEKELKRRFGYLFEQKEQFGIDIHLEKLPRSQGKGVFCGIPFDFWTYFQGKMPVNGFRFGNLAYITDIRDQVEHLVKPLKGIEHLVISALRWTPSPLHFSVDEALAFSKQVEAKHTWLTHLAHELEQTKVNAYLPTNVRLAYDGLIISFEVDE